MDVVRKTILKSINEVKLNRNLDMIHRLMDIYRADTIQEFIDKSEIKKYGNVVIPKTTPTGMGNEWLSKEKIDAYKQDKVLASFWINYYDGYVDKMSFNNFINNLDKNLETNNANLLIILMDDFDLSFGEEIPT